MALRDPPLIKRKILRANSESGLGNQRIRGRSLNPLSYKPSIPRAVANFHWFVGNYESARSLNLVGALGKNYESDFFFTRLWGL